MDTLSTDFDLDSQWKSFLENEGTLLDDYHNTKKVNDNMDTINNMNEECSGEIKKEEHNSIPKCSKIYISTKTKISYLNQEINLKELFWKIPIIKYNLQKEGIVKKQMKFNSLSEEEYKLNLLKLENEKENMIENHIIQRIVNPDGRIKFKDVRKISIGLSNKDIISTRRKKRGAFYNCFVVILRIRYDNKFKEIHVKVFNTGKLEIPGVQNDEMLNKTLELLIKELKPLVNNSDGKNIELTYVPDKNETVLINSNFSCGYFINRDKLYSILKYKYSLNCGYDPCSYPGIQCEFYYNKSNNEQNGVQPLDLNNDEKDKIIKVSFMIFRTGSVLIVGKCSEEILDKIYQFLKKILENEYSNVHCIFNDFEPKDKNRATKKKIFYISNK